MPGYPHQNGTGIDSSSDASPTVLPRGTRLSLTFRKVRKTPCNCGRFPWAWAYTDDMLVMFLPCRISLAMWFTAIRELSSCNEVVHSACICICTCAVMWSEHGCQLHAMNCLVYSEVVTASCQLYAMLPVNCPAYSIQEHSSHVAERCIAIWLAKFKLHVDVCTI